MKPVCVEIQGQIPAPIETVFDVFLPIDLTAIMEGVGPLPAVVAIEDQTGDWSSVGESRIIRLADGHGMLETLTAVERPHRFAYQISELTNALRFLVRRFKGEWRFESRSEVGGPEVVLATWRYDFEVRSWLTRPLAWLIITRYWRPYMERALELASQRALEAEHCRVRT